MHQSTNHANTTPNRISMVSIHCYVKKFLTCVTFTFGQCYEEEGNASVTQVATSTRLRLPRRAMTRRC